MVSSGEGPLCGVRVLDLSDTFMAPYTSLLLAQMGAEVIKVELPSGDITRQIGDVTGTGSGPVFLNTNRGKKSVVLDLRVNADYQKFLSLVGRSDVFLHNRRPSAARRLRIDYDTLKPANPGLIHCATVGFGGGGPYEDLPAYDDVIQAASCLASVQTGTGDPAYVRTPVVDKVTGLLAFGSIVAALYERERSGEGQQIEVPMFETMVTFMLLDQQGGHIYDPPLGPTGYSRTDSPYRRPYRTADGLIAVLVYTDGQWREFFDLVGQPELAADPRFATMRARTENIDALYSFTEAELGRRPTAEWLELLSERGIPASVVNSVADLFQDEHLTATGLFEHADHPLVGRVKTARLPVRFSRTPGPRIERAPLLGEHDDSVFDGD